MLLNTVFRGVPNVSIKQLSCDSRIKMKDCIFFCIKGVKYDGHNYIDEAIDNGANVIIYSDNIKINKKAIFIKVKSVPEALSRISNIFYHQPYRKLETYVIAGTNGRSSVSQILKFALAKRKKCASIGVFGINDDDSIEDTRQPTLPILDNVINFQNFVKNKCEVCTLEATALSLFYEKLCGIIPKAFIYTCTSEDANEFLELDKDYYDVFIHYMNSLDNNTNIVLNMDDPSFNIFSSSISNSIITYGQNEKANYIISDIVLNKDSTSFVISSNDDYFVNTKLLGMTNVYNLTAAIAALSASGYSTNEIILNLRDLNYVDGVMERINFKNFNIYVDCASSLSSYLNVFNFVRTVKDDSNKIISVISINTSDDKEYIEKLMKLSNGYSDIIVLTSNDVFVGDINSNFEIASNCLKDKNYIVVEDREEAIESACELLNVNDYLLILGKGNENYQYQGMVKKRYATDRKIAIKYINKRLNEEKDNYY